MKRHRASLGRREGGRKRCCNNSHQKVRQPVSGWPFLLIISRVIRDAPSPARTGPVFQSAAGHGPFSSVAHLPADTHTQEKIVCDLLLWLDIKSHPQRVEGWNCSSLLFIIRADALLFDFEFIEKISISLNEKMVDSIIFPAGDEWMDNVPKFRQDGRAKQKTTVFPFDPFFHRCGK